jgi:hypothetical protein
MSNLRLQYEIQLDQAIKIARFKRIELDLVMVTHHTRETRISILGHAISRAMYDLWKQKGSNVRKLCVVDKTGKVVL